MCILRYSGWSSFLDSERLKHKSVLQRIRELLQHLDVLDPENPFLLPHTVEGFFWRALMSSEKLMIFIFSLNNRYISSASRIAHNPTVSHIEEVMNVLVESGEVEADDLAMLRFIFHCALFSGYREGVSEPLTYPDLTQIPIPQDLGSTGLRSPYDFVQAIPPRVPLTEAEEEMIYNLQRSERLLEQSELHGERSAAAAQESRGAPGSETRPPMATVQHLPPLISRSAVVPEEILKDWEESISTSSFYLWKEASRKEQIRRRRKAGEFKPKKGNEKGKDKDETDSPSSSVAFDSALPSPQSPLPAVTEVWQQPPSEFYAGESEAGPSNATGNWSEAPLPNTSRASQSVSSVAGVPARSRLNVTAVPWIPGSARTGSGGRASRLSAAAEPWTPTSSSSSRNQSPVNPNPSEGLPVSPAVASASAPLPSRQGVLDLSGSRQDEARSSVSSATGTGSLSNQNRTLTTSVYPGAQESTPRTSSSTTNPTGRSDAGGAGQAPVNRSQRPHSSTTVVPTNPVTAGLPIHSSSASVLASQVRSNSLSAAAVAARSPTNDSQSSNSTRVTDSRLSSFERSASSSRPLNVQVAPNQGQQPRSSSSAIPPLSGASNPRIPPNESGSSIPDPRLLRTSSSASTSASSMQTSTHPGQPGSSGINPNAPQSNIVIPPAIRPSAPSPSGSSSRTQPTTQIPRTTPSQPVLSRRNPSHHHEENEDRHNSRDGKNPRNERTPKDK